MVLIDFERVNEPAKIVIFPIVNEPQHRASFTIWKSIICRFFAHFATSQPKIFWSWRATHSVTLSSYIVLNNFFHQDQNLKNANKILPFQQAQKSAYGWASNITSSAIRWFFSSLKERDFVRVLTHDPKTRNIQQRYHFQIVNKNPTLTPHNTWYDPLSILKFYIHFCYWK